MQTNYYELHPSEYEIAPDYSETQWFKRFKSMILNPSAPDNPSADLSDYFDTDQTKFLENDIAAPPDHYSQSTIGIAWEDEERSYYDFYNDGRTWVSQDDYRYGDYLFDGDRVALTRLNLQGDGVDRLLVVKRNEEEELDALIYTPNGGLLHTDAALARDNAEGEFVGITAANLIAERVFTWDPDEIVVARRKTGDSTINLRVYKVSSLSDNQLTYTFSPLSDPDNAAALSRVVDNGQLADDSFLAAIGLRTEAVRYFNNMRNLDDLVIAGRDPLTSDMTLSVKRNGIVSAEPLSADSVNLDGLFVAEAVDLDQDRRDEIVVVRQDGSGSRLDIYDGDMEPEDSKELDRTGVAVTDIFARRTAILVNGTYEMPPGNLALGASASMNAGPGWGNMASKAVDGDINTWAQSDNPFPWDLTIDLGGAATIDEVLVIPIAGSHATAYTIQVSNNGSTWSTVATESAGGGYDTVYRFAPVSARYVRIDVTDSVGTSSNSGHVIREVGVYHH